MKMAEDKTRLELERRFGKPEEDVVTRFGEDYFNGIEGWQFPEETLYEANREGRLLTMDLDVPSGCKLDCVYCFAKEDAYYRPQEGDRPLTLDEIEKHLEEAKELGLESAKIVGFGEPFENKRFYDFIDFATEQGIHLVVFTAAYTLGEKRFGGSLEKAVDFLAEHDVSLMVKLHTLDRENEDNIVRKEGYSKIRDRYLKALLDDERFTASSPTRLGIEDVVASQDINELVGIYEYFKIFRNVFVDIDPPIPVGRTATAKQAETIGLDQEKLKELCVKIYQTNQKYGIPFKGVSSFFGGVPCSQLPNGLYLTLSGSVNTCCGGNEIIGNVREQSLTEIFTKNHPYRNKVK